MLLGKEAFQQGYDDQALQWFRGAARLIKTLELNDKEKVFIPSLEAINEKVTHDKVLHYKM